MRADLFTRSGSGRWRGGEGEEGLFTDAIYTNYTSQFSPFTEPSNSISNQDLIG